MATQPQEREPIRVAVVGYGTQRVQLSASHAQPIQFYDPRDIDAPVEEVIVRGCNEVVLQGRMKGDFYAEATGPNFCVSAIGDDIASATRAALAKAEA